LIEKNFIMWLRKADFITGIILAAFGGIAFALALKAGWDLPAVRQDGWYTAPGLVPAGAALLLLGLGTYLSLDAFKQRGGWSRQDFAQLKAACAEPALRRIVLTASLLLVYVFGVVGRVHFVLASFLFLAAFMFLFKAAAWWKVLVISASVSAAIGFLFQHLARIPLP
jgi:hypothetical protein